MEELRQGVVCCWVVEIHFWVGAPFRLLAVLCDFQQLNKAIPSGKCSKQCCHDHKLLLPLRLQCSFSPCSHFEVEVFFLFLFVSFHLNLSCFPVFFSLYPFHLLFFSFFLCVSILFICFSFFSFLFLLFHFFLFTSVCMYFLLFLGEERK